jgi:hypothetical protein
MKTIYLASHAWEQLNGDDRWYDPIPFSEKLEAGYTCRLRLKDDEEYAIKNREFYPDRTEVDSVAERLERLEAPKPRKPRKKRAKAPPVLEDIVEETEEPVEPDAELPTPRRARRKIDVPAGPTLWIARIPYYEVFFDHTGNYITQVHENDASFRDEYHSGLLENFGIQVRRFDIPAKTYGKIEASIEESGDLDDEAIDEYIKPALAKILKLPQ